MAKFVLSDLEKLDYRTTQKKVQLVEKADDISSDLAEVISVLPDTQENVSLLENALHTIYIPASLLPIITGINEKTQVYFELENFPFYQTAKDIIEQRAMNEKPKGVFRYRRKVTKADDNILVSDLFVIFSLLGNPVDIQITRTNQNVDPAHTIILLNFGEGTLAHVEYTVTDEERIELEWSGIKSIIEFDSNEMNPFEPINKTKLPLMYPIDSIITHAKPFNEALVNQMTQIKNLLDGGGQK